MIYDKFTCSDLFHIQDSLHNIFKILKFPVYSSYIITHFDDDDDNFILWLLIHQTVETDIHVAFNRYKI